RPASTERRDNQHRDAKPQANWAGNRWTADDGRVRHRGRGHKFSGRAGRRRYRRNVIKKSPIFIVGDKQNRLCPQCWVHSESLDEEGKNVLTKDRRRRRVIRG